MTQPFTIADLLVAFAWIAAGLATWSQTPTRRSSALMASFGGTWLLGALYPPLVLLHRGVLAHLVLAYPSGRVDSTGGRTVLATFYGTAILAGMIGGSTWTLVYAAALAGAALVRFATSSGAVRRRRAVPLAVALGAGAVLAVASLGELAGAAEVDLLATYELTLVLAALGFAADLRAAAWSQAAMTGLVVDLGRRPTDGVVRERLARALGDPSLAVVYMLEDGRPPIDERGRPLALPAVAGRTVTPVRHGGRQVAALIHDPAALSDPRLLEGAASALSVALANARLQADVRAHVEALEASARRLIDAEDAQRRGLGAELRADVDPLLDEAGRSLLAVGADELYERLDAVRGQLARFASGLELATLHEGGLRPALRVLADQSGLPVTLSLPDARYPADVESCVWFVCSEATANALKHADASRLSIEVGRHNGRLRVEVADDGVGGAAPELGSGLRRLAERVQARGGVLTVDSGPGQGTKLVAELDLGAETCPRA